MAAFLALILPLATWFAAPRLYRWRQRRRLLRVCRAHRVVAITFDDGPGRQLTPVVLERLALAGVPATFFLLGRQIPGREDVVARIRDHGHEIGSHGVEHEHHLNTWPWRGVRDMTASLRHLETLLDRRRGDVAFRPPHGKMNPWSMLVAWWRGTPVATWTHDSNDTRLDLDEPPRETADRLRRSGGGVVLLHDFDRTIPNPTARVLARLDAILRLQLEGYRFVRFADLDVLARGGAVPAPVRPLRLAPPDPAPPLDPPLWPPQKRRRRKKRHPGGGA
ncbi:MAG: polysaccharide deacetylase family protein [Planctomycetota bacterium]